MIDTLSSPIEVPASAKITGAKHPITAKEDALFEEWVVNRPQRYPFATDGCADPESFEKSAYRIVFVLKERNWGHTVEDQREYAKTQIDPSKRLTELREDKGRKILDSWWTLMAQWAEVLLAKEPVDWPAIETRFLPVDSPASPMSKKEIDNWIQDKNIEALGKCACVQLKKSPGGGTMNKADFKTIVSEDRELILRQFAIYSPHFIVSCGSNDNWNMFRYTLFPKPEVKRTRNGIQYFIASSPDNGLCKTAVINFGHPSMRVNSNLWGSLAIGLREALKEIATSCGNLGASLT